MIAAALALIAAAMACWPVDAPAALRLAGLSGSGRMPQVRARRSPALRWGAIRRPRRAPPVGPDLLRAVRLLVHELSSGADPARAWAGAAAVGGSAAPWLSEVAASAASGGSVGQALAAAADGLEPSAPEQARAVRRLGAAWACGAGSGSSSADVAAQWAVDAEDRARALSALESQVAGPRACAVLLAGLPALGLAMGSAMGADPVRMLTAGPAGFGLLAAGLALEAAGVLWVRRIVRSALRA